MYIAGIIGAILKDKFTFGEAVYGTAYSVLGYSIVFWVGFFILIGVLDILFFSFDKQPKYTNYKLAAEWILISSPFIYLFIRYNQWIFLVAILAFLIGQYLIPIVHSFAAANVQFHCPKRLYSATAEHYTRKFWTVL